MSRVGVMVLGPAGVGKSTFCSSLLNHIQSVGRRAHLVNLDPAAEPGEYEFTVDIRDLISLEDVMQEMSFGPNGGLLYCFEFLMNHLDWLDEEIGDYEDEFLIFDCPGQIELYTHIPVLPTLAKHLTQNLGFSLCASYLLEAPFVIDRPKFFSGVMSAMSAMILLELPHINILSKLDLIKDDMSKQQIKSFLSPDATLLSGINSSTNSKFYDLNRALVELIDDFGMVQFLPLDSTNSDSVAMILSYIDDITQWAEAQEPKEPKDEAFEEGDEQDDPAGDLIAQLINQG
ncbi:GPN-loop GTPase [Myxozyma melibiosi]|uniref:GPN-loop GTPase 3 n=1 Tax=Myxozyma melibiosi TaxID=54550 RepID=A0ABR1F3T2_9ASCO